MTRTDDDDVDDATVITLSLREPERFSALFRRHAPHIHRYLARRLGTGVADDLLAETFLVAFRRRERYAADRPDARPWLYGIATHLVGQHRREEVRRCRLQLAVPAEVDAACHADRVAADVTSQALRHLLLTAVGDLADGDRDVLLLVAWEELSYEEVAAALAIPVGTVRSRLNRARRKVRDTLGAAEPMTTIEEVLHSGR
ncbi:RNA polymerase sigma factor [Longispora sp. K20-0274]|uniref:RNA polymerase sigma factor n=1 Tax=Longispora sp. K20-0274 TaxID=3088255 RepID=UPI003999978B